MSSSLLQESQLSGGWRVASLVTLKLQSDERLVELVRAGCEPAFEAIVERYRWSLLRYCGRVLGPDRAQDAVQQTFISAYKTILQDGREIRLKGWLYRIAHNTSLKILEKKGWDHEVLDENYDGVARPPELVEQRERLGALVDQIRELPDRQRSALLMHEFEGRSYKEIANRLSGSVPVVRELIFRARTSLRNGLGMLVPLKWIQSLLARAPSGAASPERVADLVAGTRAVAGVVQVAAALVIAGTVVTGVAVRSAEHGNKGLDRNVGARTAVSATPSSPGDVFGIRAALRVGSEISGGNESGDTKPPGVPSNGSLGHRDTNGLDDAQDGGPQARSPGGSALAPTEGDSPSARPPGSTASIGTSDSGRHRDAQDGLDDKGSKSGDGRSGRDSEGERDRDRGSDDRHGPGSGDDDHKSDDSGGSGDDSGDSSGVSGSSGSSGSSGGGDSGGVSGSGGGSGSSGGSSGSSDSGSSGSGSGSSDGHHGGDGHGGDSDDAH